MNIDQVIAQLREHAPLFAGNVAGAAQYTKAAADQVWLPMPAAYVIPINDEAAPNTMQGGSLIQIVRETIGIIVVLDNSADRRGQAAATNAVNEARQALFGALLNWRMDLKRNAQGFAYERGALLPDSFTRAWLAWQFDFTIATQITDRDGVQITGNPLVRFAGAVTPNDGAGEKLFEIDFPFSPPPA